MKYRVEERGGGALLSEKVRNARRNMCKLTKRHCLILRAHILVAEKVQYVRSMCRSNVCFMHTCYSDHSKTINPHVHAQSEP